MNTRHRAGSGFSRHENALRAGTEAAAGAIQQGGITNPLCALAFCSGDMDHRLFLQGILQGLGNEAPVYGGSAIGVMTAQELNYRGSSAGCMVIESGGISIRPAAGSSVKDDTFGVGKRVGDALAVDDQSSLMLLFYDSIIVPAGENSPPVLNSSAPLIAGLMETGVAKLPVFGAGLIGRYTFGAVSLFTGSKVEQDCAVGLVINGAVRPYFHIMHGCSPLDGVYHRITAKDGPVLYELDGRPITEMIDDLGLAGWRNQFPLEYLTIGINCGERYSPPQEGHYINRLITGLTPDGRGVCMFEPDLEQGMEIQFMIRDTEKMMESVQVNCARLTERLRASGDRPFMALYIDCARRTAEYSRTKTEEAAEIQSLCRDLAIPLLGFYSGVEIAPLLGKPRGLDWTGVLVIIAESI